jgi:hypothetical protein
VNYSTNLLLKKGKHFGEPNSIAIGIFKAALSRRIPESSAPLPAPIFL